MHLVFYFAQVVQPSAAVQSVQTPSISHATTTWAGPEGITAIATCAAALFALIALVSLWFLRAQLILLRTQIAGDHHYAVLVKHVFKF
jgi:hypothetical protein